MLMLSTTSMTLRLVTSLTGNVLYVADWNDLNTVQTQAFMGTNTGSVASATTTTMVGSPGASTERTIRQLIIKNVDASTNQNVTIQKFDGTRSYDLFPTVALAPQMQLSYIEYEGWTIYQANGVPLIPSGGMVGVGNYEADVYAGGVLVLQNALINFVNTGPVGFAVQANSTTMVNVAANVSGNINVTNLNVSQNIQNAGNIAVSQNISTGNLLVVQNTTEGNLTVQQNAAIGNLVVSGITSLANLNVTNLNVSANIQNAGNILVSQNVAAGNIKVGNILNLQDSPNPATPPVGNLYVISSGIGGGSQLNQLEIWDAWGAFMAIGYETHIVVFNITGVNIPKGSLVYITGNTTIGGTYYPTIGLAQANSMATMPCVGVAQYNVPNNSFGEVHAFGPVSGLALTTGTSGQRLYVSDITAGLMTVVPPNSPTSFIQEIGSVVNTGPGNQGVLLFRPHGAAPAGSNGSANTVQVYSNNVLVANQANLNFINSTFVSMNATAVGVDTTVNVSSNLNIGVVAGVLSPYWYTYYGGV